MGKYGKAKLIGTSTTSEQTTMPEPEPSSITEPAHGQPTPLPEIGGAFADFIETECVTLLQIEKVVKETMKRIEPTKIHDGGKIGMHTKEIYRESKKMKFEKASES